MEEPVSIIDAPNGSFIGPTHPNAMNELLEAESKAKQPSHVSL